MNLSSNTSIKNCLMKIKFSLNVWKQKKNAVLIFL